MSTYTEISYGLFDVTAKEDSTPTCSDKQPFINMNQLLQEDLQVEKYGTLEQNQFLLDGTMKLFPDAPENEKFGLWSLQMSDSNGNFATPITLAVDFTANHSSLGLTLYFLEGTEDYCNRLNAKYYDSSEVLLLDKDYTPDKPLYFAEAQVENYRKVVITFYSTNKPYRYLKLAEIKYGALKIFYSEDIISASVLEEIDPISAELSINTLDFKVHTSDFAILDPKGIYTLLQKKQAVKVVEYVNGIKMPMGTFYLDEPESDSNNTTSMSCIDAIGIADQTNFKGGIYVDKSVTELLDEIATSAKLKYTLDSSFSGVTVTGWISICSHREACQQVAFAIGAIVDCSRSDTINFYPVPTTITIEIPKSRKVDDHSVKQKSLVTGVEVTAHKYVASTESEELCNETLSVGTHEITFSGPHHSLNCTGATITASNANYAKLTVSTAGTVVLTGKTYNDNMSVIGVYATELPANEKANVLQVTDAYLVSGTNAKAVAQRIYDYYQLRYEDEGSIVLGNEKPGEKVSIESLSNKSIQGIIESMNINLTGGYLAQTKITGEAV